jgi:geranylgeranyl diphosphate synthase type II
LRIKKHTYILKIAFSEKDAAQLQHLFTAAWDNVTKIESVKDIFNNSGASKANQDAIKSILLNFWKKNEYREEKGYIKSFGKI